MIIDTSGRIVSKYENVAGSYTIPLEGLNITNGMYFAPFRRMAIQNEKCWFQIS